MKHLLITFLILGSQLHAAEGQRFDLSKRASEIDPRAKEHPEIKFTFTDDKGKPADLQHAVVDTRVPSQGKLVIWLMGHNQGLFERISSYGYHGIQPHYSNGWFAGLTKTQYADGSGTAIGKVRLEAATGEDFSPLVNIPKPDGMMDRSLQFVKWLVKENPDVWTPAFKEELRQLMATAVTLEKEFIRDCLPVNGLGLSSKEFEQYIDFIADRRLRNCGLDPLVAETTNPFPWLSEMMDLKKEQNFFEGRVTEYQKQGALGTVNDDEL
jgi:hypothetical protein